MQLYMFFRFLGDIAHTLSKFILIWAIHSNRSAEGVSLITQILYLLVFCARYLDWFWKYPIGPLGAREEGQKGLLWWNFILKFFYVTTSAYIVAVMMRLFPRTREREKAWRLGAYILAGSAISAPLVCLILRDKETTAYTFFEVVWTFSIELESVCVVPQLLLLRQTTVPTVLDSYYLVALGSYRALYLVNWIAHWATDGWRKAIPECFGIIQTILYIDFAWVYFSRQRVKLRGGGIVDSDDLSRGWLVSKFLPRRSVDADEAERGGTYDGSAPAPSQGRWGARGISVSADDTVREETEPLTQGQGGRLTDPGAFEDLDSDAEERTPSTSSGQPDTGGVSNGSEWRDSGATK